MKALVTGGLGFIGSHLIDLLISGDHEVAILDNKSSSVVNDDNRCSIQIQSVEEANFTYFHQLFSPDIVFHLASPVGPAGILNKVDIGPSIINDTHKMLNFCAETNIPLIDISTSEVYGRSGILKEDSEKVCSGKYEMRTEYGVAKLLAEVMIENRAKVKGVKYHIIRPFNVAGPRQLPDGGFVLPRFIIATLTDQPITIFGDGSQIRAFTDVRDICDAILKIAFSEYKNEIWNIGNPANKMSIKELAEKVAGNKLIHYIDPNKLHGPLFAEAKDKIPYIAKIEKLLSWEPKVAFEETLKDTTLFWKTKIKEGYLFDVCKGKNLNQLI